MNRTGRHYTGPASLPFIEPSQTIRLEGLLSANGSGRVEVFYQGEWGTICNGYWDMRDVAVVCRELGFKDAKTALPESQVSDGSGKIWLDNVDCTGSEQNLSSCFHTEWGINDCTHDVSGVECSSTGKVSVLARFIYLHAN